MKTSPAEIFNQRIQQFDSEVKAIDAKLGRVAFLRLITFVVALIGLIFFKDAGGWIVSGIISVSSLIFLMLVQWNYNLDQKKIFQENLVKINQTEIDLLERNLEKIPGGGLYEEDSHPYSGDFDIFGDKSIYQLINRATSRLGCDQLADWLLTTPQSDITARQQSVRELKDKLDWRQHFQATGMLYKGEGVSLAATESWMSEPPVLLPQKYWLLAPGLLSPLMLLFFIGGISGFLPWTLFFISIGLSMLVARQLGPKLQNVFPNAEKQSHMLNSWKELIARIETGEFESAQLKKLKAKLQSQDVIASKEIKKVVGYLKMLEIRYSGMQYLMLNLFFFWDIIWVRQLEKWKRDNREKATAWLEVVAEFEAYGSLAAFAYAHPEFTFPEIVSDKYQLIAEEAGHPLIPDGARIHNPIHLNDKGQVLLITGSNMSGKSTYLRTVGINAVLAMAGTVVCARKFSISPMRIISSMRTKDSLSESVSSFYAELKRLKQVLEITEKEDRVLFLLDEVLKGTNSIDRHKGAAALIHQLIQLGGSGMVSTHDLELTALETDLPGKVINFSFNSKMEGDQLIFDYTLTTGACKSFNASQLMRMMGIQIGIESSPS